MPALRPYTSSKVSDDDEASPQSYEALLISALIESGKFNPEAYHVTSDDIVGWGKVWAFCRDYQASSGQAPKLNLLASIHPEFTFTEGVSAAWAATRVVEESAMRNLRMATHASLAAVTEGDVDGAFSPLEQLQRPRGHTKPPANLFDISAVAAAFETTKIEVPYASLRRMLGGGLDQSEFALIAARLGQGKSHILCHFMAQALNSGWRVACMSLEMPARQINLRTLKHLSGTNRTLFEMLDSEDEIKVKKAIEQLGERTPGTLDVYDPSHGAIGTTAMLNDLARDYDIVCVDHLGLMKTKEHKRAIEDWRVMSTISNITREITLDTGTTVIGVAQVNRQGVHHGTQVTPKAGELAQSDALGQDATTIITMKRLSRRIMKFSLEKSREGATGAWYGRFDPAANRWDELSKDLAMDISGDDDSFDD